jgi:hypothetical protein
MRIIRMILWGLELRFSQVESRLWAGGSGTLTSAILLRIVFGVMRLLIGLSR